MPRELILLTERPPAVADMQQAAVDTGTHARAAAADGGAMFMLLDSHDEPLLALQYTKHVRVPDELVRLAPAAVAAAPRAEFWTEAWCTLDSSTGPQIATALATLCGGVCIDENGVL